MATSSGGTGRSGEERRQAPAAGGARPSGAGAESQRGGETVPVGRSGPGLPEEFGPYRVKKQLGGGGMGAVYLVENTELQREEALKVPHFDPGADAAVRQRFLQEARAAAGLRHPNLCPVYHVGVQDGICFLTMPYLQGRPLSDFAGRAQPARKAVECVARLAQALAAAHAAGVIHRDLKPGNIMMCAGVGPVVMDFGLSRRTQEQNERLTQAGAVLGTPAYMPPEQVNGELDRMGPASDVYSLGVILYELLTGHLPFEAPGAAVFGQILYAEPAPPSTHVPGLHPALDEICGKALAKAPEQRYPTMKAFAAALVEYLQLTPPAEGAGNLVPAKGRSGEVFQAATVAPTPAPPRAPQPRGGDVPMATVLGGQPPSSGRPPAASQPISPEATVLAGPRPAPAARPRGLLLGCAAGAALVLLVGAVGGIGALVYSLHGTGPAASDGTQAASTGPASTTPSPGKDAVLGDGPAAPVSMSGHAQGAVCGSLVFMPDGRHAVSHCNGDVYVWDLQKRRLLSDPLSLDGGPVPGLVAVAPDGQHLAAFVGRALTFLKFDGTRCARDGAPLTSAPFTAVAFSPDGARLATAERERGQGRVRLTALPSRTHQNEFLFGAAVTALAFSPDGKFLVTSGLRERTIRVMNLEQQRQEDRGFQSQAEAVTRLGFSRDGSRLFSAGSGNLDATVGVWDFATGKEVQTIRAAGLVCAAFWPGGRALTGHADGDVVLWDLDTGKELARFPFKPPPGGPRVRGPLVTAVAISPDGHHGLAALADGLVYLFRLPPPTGKTP
jgi:serine/threonine protein kinase